MLKIRIFSISRRCTIPGTFGLFRADGIVSSVTFGLMSGTSSSCACISRSSIRLQGSQTSMSTASSTNGVSVLEVMAIAYHYSRGLRYSYRSVQSTLDEERNKRAFAGDNVNLDGDNQNQGGGKTKAAAAKAKANGKGKAKAKSAAPGKPGNSGGGNIPPRAVTSKPADCPAGVCWDHFVNGSCVWNAVGKCSFEHPKKAKAAAAKAKAKAAAAKAKAEADASALKAADKAKTQAQQAAAAERKAAAAAAEAANAAPGKAKGKGKKAKAKGVSALEEKPKSSKGPALRSINKFCGFFEKGTCRHGDKCAYTHGTADPRPMAAPTLVGAPILGFRTRPNPDFNDGTAAAPAPGGQQFRVDVYK